ncbi:MAG: hypothetical protein AVDCRST_MAG68-1217 [uncultured Gemmatimonadetes bacterium]|uniref:Uncharacterized protein n=1 Tax=uncultured Gemmatimonadota bacterium TaxID=203437 RepID=A0A6J4KNL7_9BACT|nr:MAG: hypothetical protein AVDCRST_MAG68-1217 [uncultured Gemmatimonadota bacterium]
MYGRDLSRPRPSPRRVAGPPHPSRAITPRRRQTTHPPSPARPGAIAPVPSARGIAGSPTPASSRP